MLAMEHAELYFHTPYMPSGSTYNFFLISLCAVFTDEELEALLDRSDMLSAASVSSDTGIQTKRKGRVSIYKVIGQQCGDSKVKQFS
jgi:hypothetical protein